MTYTRPFITSRFTAYAGDSLRRRLSLAVSVIDAFTGKQAVVPLRVFLKGLRQLRSLRSRSGFFYFEGNIPGELLPAGDYTLVVDPDPTTADFFYLQPGGREDWTDKFERKIKLPLPDEQSPLEIVTLSPKPSYPFPSNATLVRGKVITGAPEVGVSGAVISSTYDQVDPADNDRTISVDVETQTDLAGEYVLFFKKLPGKTQRITVVAAKGGQQDEVDVEITEGTTRAADPLHLP